MSAPTDVRYGSFAASQGFLSDRIFYGYGGKRVKSNMPKVTTKRYRSEMILHLLNGTEAYKLVRFVEGALDRIKWLTVLYLRHVYPVQLDNKFTYGSLERNWVLRQLLPNNNSCAKREDNISQYCG